MRTANNGYFAEFMRFKGEALKRAEKDPNSLFFKGMTELAEVERDIRKKLYPPDIYWYLYKDVNITNYEHLEFVKATSYSGGEIDLDFAIEKNKKEREDYRYLEDMAIGMGFPDYKN